MKKYFSSISFILLTIILLGLAACGQTDIVQDIPPAPAPCFAIEDYKVNLTLVAAGDNLIHGPIYRQARNRTDGNGFDFAPAYQPVSSYIAAADLALINQETPLGGTELGLSSYPQFNSPQEVGEQLLAMGFNLISHANNHVLDAGQKGFFNTIAFWREQSAAQTVVMAGIAADAADDQLQILNYQGTKVALLAYTYGTNGLRLPAGSSGIVKYIDDELICQELAQAQAEADIVLVSMHWGQEYQANPNAEQQRLAQLLADNGADIIIGSHPHVLQTVDLLTASDGRQVPVFYSLGNFISAQNRADTMLGGLAEVQMVYDRLNHILTIEQFGVIPLVTHYTGSYSNITVYPLAAYTAEQARAHGVSSISLDYLRNLFNARIPEQYQVWR